MTDRFLYRNEGESDFDWGFRNGIEDVILHSWQLRHYSWNFQRGYKWGRDKLESLIDDAVSRRI